MLTNYIRKLVIISSIFIPATTAEILLTPSAQALPGESTEEVLTWIQAHPTLQPRTGEKLFVVKSDTASQRFTFQASVLPPGKITFTKDRSTIRTERITLFDAINGVSLERLEESLRVIYSLDIYQDYKNAAVAYQYPNQSAINQARLTKTPIREALQGQIRIGDRFAYWVEIAQPKQGKAITGKITVLLKQDLDKLETELRNR